MFEGNNIISSVLRGSDSISKILFNNSISWKKQISSDGDLPQGYTRCEYLESTGTQYIDTGYIPKENSIMKYDFKSSKTNTEGFTTLFGCQKSTTEERIYILFGGFNNINNIQVNLLNVSYPGYYGLNMDSTFNTNEKGNFFTNDRMTYIINQLNKTISIGSITWDFSKEYTGFKGTKNTIMLLTRNNNGTPDNTNGYSKGYSYGFEVLEGEEQKMNLIPCLDSNNRPCMYDKVTGKTFYNNGEGEFLYKVKNTLPFGYAECEYLESNGVQYIDTKIKCSDINYSNYEIEACIQNLSKYTDQNQYALVGAYEVGKAFQFGMNAISASEERITMNMGFDSAISYTGLKLGEWRTLYSSSGIQRMNNNVIANKQSINNFTDLTFYLFARNGESTYKQLHKERISYLYIKSNGKTILNLIPCLDNNGIPCMYDTVSKQTFYNQGEGEFVYKLKYPKLITESKLGFPASNSTSISTNSTYPYSYYFNDIYLENGKKYKITFYNKRVPSGTDDGTLRFRLINKDGTFYANCLRTNYEDYWNVESLEYVGNWYGMKEIVFSPKEKTHYLRMVTQISKNNPPNFYLEKVEEIE